MMGQTFLLPKHYYNDIILPLGTDNDIVLVERSTTLGANTALTNVLVGTPVSLAIAADSLILSNVTASGDIAMYGNRGGNSEQFLFYDTSAGVLYLTPTFGGLTIGLGTGAPAPANADNVRIWVSTATATASSVAPLVIEKATGGNLIHMLVNGTPSTGLQVSQDATAKSGYIILHDDVADAWSFGTAGALKMVLSSTYLQLANGMVKLTLGTLATFATTQPTNTLVLYTGTAPAGSITTSVGLFTDGIVMKKIIASGTVSNVET